MANMTKQQLREALDSGSHVVADPLDRFRYLLMPAKRYVPAHLFSRLHLDGEIKRVDDGKGRRWVKA